MAEWWCHPWPCHCQGIAKAHSLSRCRNRPRGILPPSQIFRFAELLDHTLRHSGIIATEGGGGGGGRSTANDTADGGQSSEALPLETSSDRAIRLVDCGCGKGYLTFAAHALLKERGVNVETIGIEVPPSFTHTNTRHASLAHEHAQTSFPPVLHARRG